MIVSTVIPVMVSSVSGAEALLWIKGSLGVRIMWITRVWLHMDSTNQPAWNIPMYFACIMASSAPLKWVARSLNSTPPETKSGQNTKYMNR